ncbi:MAG: branched-chain amino acid ABC transporter permease [Fastidiosipila sp.]|jgi:branched-chain amino acid transport system permease protein|nr:branched-chain amino acid ABC transporter permease [Fastidiosipila sp.]
MAASEFRKRSFASLIALLLTAALYLLLHLLIKAGIIGPFIRGILNVACINIVAAVSLNLVTGLLGQLVLGHAGFMLVGAYTAALITKNSALVLGFSLPLSLLAGGASAAIVGLVIALPALRLRGDYLAIVTLGFGEIIRVVANNLEFTGGPAGLSGIKSLTTKLNPSGMFNLIFPITAFVIYFSYTFGTSRHGRAVRSIREDEIAAENNGIHTTYYKLMAFTLAAFFAGIAGGLYAHQIGVIAPSRFDFNRSVEILMMVVLGGMGSITGAVISATFLTALPELLRSLGKLLSNILPNLMTGFFNNFDQYRMLIYSTLLIVVMLFRPKGLLGRSEMRLIPFVDLFSRKKQKGGAP